MTTPLMAPSSSAARTKPKLPDYFPTRVPPEVRNAIYDAVVADAIHEAESQNPDLSYPLYYQDNNLVFRRCLSLCGVNQRIRKEFGKLVVRRAMLHADYKDMPRLLATFYAPSCLQGHCQHRDHSTRPQEVTILVSPYHMLDTNPFRITDLMRAKAWDRNLLVRFKEKSIFPFLNHSTKVPRDILDIAARSPTSELMNGIQSELIRSIVLWPPKLEALLPWRWILGLRKASGGLTENERDAVFGHCVVLCSRRDDLHNHLAAVVRVQDEKGRISEEYKYWPGYKTLVQKFHDEDAEEQLRALILWGLIHI